jgi:hypothetical protein
MNKIETDITGETAADASRVELLQLRGYVWRPWYAKAWWIAIPLYWMPAGLPGFDWFRPLYVSSLGIFLNVVLTPLVAFLILGFRYFQLRLNLADREWRADLTYTARRRRGGPHWSIDPLDPRSSLWIGHHRKP